MLVGAFDVTNVFLWPVALFTDRLRRSRTSWRETNGTIKIVAHRVIKLFHAVHFRLEVRGRARADVTRYALHAGMRGVLISNELRLHW